ncbi:MAG: formylmethanofuran dehydrogenase subunit [Methylobacteriaceae bacterium]|jgi:formylmethanofuran dehydrogenase subunit A|nr:formylmethanofuran dehydrogenase subunit [Methylobacteriaceae bacterium]
MLTCLRGGRIIDPVGGDTRVGDLFIGDDRVVAQPPGRTADHTYDVTGKIIMAGGIDIHSHIAGGNVNTARLLLPELHPGQTPSSANLPLSTARWSTFETGCLYAKMGFTTVVEPAVSPHHALHAHLELADTPIIDKATLTVLGNDDFLLSMLRDGDSANAIADYVAATMVATRGLGVKCINAGGATAFKYNARAFSLDDVVPHYGVTSRAIVEALQQAVTDLKIPHPLHLHMNNLGIAGNVETALATIDAARGLPLHLAHVQFYAYGTEGRRGFSSAAARLAEAVNAAKNVTVDVGQVMFGPTVTVSLDVLRQYNGSRNARPNKWIIFDGDANGGGIVPYDYRRSDFYNAVQWACGLELFLLIDDPSRVFFTTDHPNGAPFTTYPDLLALLMSRDLRAEWLAEMPRSVAEMTILASIAREYTLEEIATMTRAAPAKLLGLADRGHLSPGARADIAVYNDDTNRARMFRDAHLVFKDGDLVVRDGAVTHYRAGRTLEATPQFDRAIERRLDAYYDEVYRAPRDLFTVHPDALPRTARFEQVGLRQ